MARIKLGPLVTEISGSIGGFTFQRNRYGVSLRTKPLPLRSQTSPQLLIRHYIKYLQFEWRDLSPAERLQWERFTDFSLGSINRDKSVMLSGYNLFLKYQLMRLLTGGSLLTTISYVPLPDIGLFDQIFLVAFDLRLDFTFQVDHTKYFFLFHCTIPRHPSISFSKRGLRYMQIGMATAAGFMFDEPYIAAFGALPAEGDTVHYSIQYFSAVAPIFSSKYTGTSIIVGP